MSEIWKKENTFLNDIREIIDAARQNAVRSVDFCRVQMYWHMGKRIFEEEQQRLDKMRKYAQAIRAKNFPIDADMLVNNFFKTLRKDPEGAKKILENNPATFAPIQVDKIPPRFFGMIKTKPEDGFRVNRQLGKFLKKLKA